MKIIFTVDEINQILGYLDQLPYRLAKPIIEQIQAIAGPQVQSQELAEKAEDEQP